MSQLIFVRNKAQPASRALPGEGGGAPGAAEAVSAHWGQRLLPGAAAGQGHPGTASLWA